MAMTPPLSRASLTPMSFDSATPPGLKRPLGGLRPRAAGAEALNAERHRRLVARLKIVLPATAAALLGLVFVYLAVNDRGGSAGERASLPAIEMSAPDLTGIDAEGRPYSVKAAAAAQRPDGLIAIDRVEARLTLEGGGALTVRADRGAIDREAGKLELEGSVEASYGGLYRFVTDRIGADLKATILTGDRPVRVEGPMGWIAANGFTIRRTVRDVTFTGGVTGELTPADFSGPGTQETTP
jgi:lipopolysaccharide export system protein LptC